MIAYYELGVTTFLIRGFDPIEDAIDYGRELIPSCAAKSPSGNKNLLRFMVLGIAKIVDCTGMGNEGQLSFREETVVQVAYG